MRTYQNIHTKQELLELKARLLSHVHKSESGSRVKFANYPCTVYMYIK